jgi:hypothetical protein
LREIVRNLDPEVAVNGLTTLEREVADSIAIVRIMGMLMPVMRARLLAPELTTVRARSPGHGIMQPVMPDRFSALKNTLTRLAPKRTLCDMSELLLEGQTPSQVVSVVPCLQTALPVVVPLFAVPRYASVFGRKPFFEILARSLTKIRDPNQVGLLLRVTNVLQKLPHRERSRHDSVSLSSPSSTTSDNPFGYV